MPDVEHVIAVEPDGTFKCLYTEEIDLRELGALTTERASHVEPNNETGLWEVRLASGQYIGARPTRKEALEFEVRYLQERL
jgi:hypothetical protein